MNLFHKQPSNKLPVKDEAQYPGPAINVQGSFHVPITSQQQAKIIHLQQSDFAPRPSNGRTAGVGMSNPAFEESNTTHL